MGILNNITPVVKNLLIINGLFFLATGVAEVMGVDLIKMLGLHNLSSEAFKPLQVVTHMFMHGGIWHILMNMFMLLMMGKLLESVWGAQKFLFYYLFTGLGAAALNLYMNEIEISQLQESVQNYSANPSYESFVIFLKESIGGNYSAQLTDFLFEWSDVGDNQSYNDASIVIANQILQGEMNTPMVGASGAIFGILLAFGMLFRNMMLVFPFPMKAKYFVFAYGALELIRGYQNAPNDNIAHFAHLGGMLFGYILLKIWKEDKTVYY